MVLVSVVLPTFNEAGHIQELLTELLTELGGLDHEIVVVDDDSPDGTWRVVEAYAVTHPTVRLVRRVNEKGLATAVIEGMRQAKGIYVVVMDSDGQHPPAVVPRLVDAALRKDCDLVVGSRYAEGGIVEGFPPMRRLISWGAKMLAVVGLPAVRRFKVRDPMSGLFLVARQALPDLSTLKPRGYKILLEVLAKAHLERVSEVGYHFQVRRSGDSKLKAKTQVDYALHVASLALRDRENLRLAMFAFVGATGILVNLAPILYAERVLALTDPWALFVWAAVAREAAVLWDFVFNDVLTFRDLRHSTGRSWWARMVRYHIATLASFLVYLVLFTSLVAVGTGPTISAVIAIAVGFLVNWLGNRHWTYRQASEETPDA
jgi:dolichol-phosphate mannosyltransferase